MLGLPLTFTAPLVLIALAALPAIWLLLRITPPQPTRVDFPPLKIVADMRPERETPARTPWWLLLLRLLLAAFLILAAAGPIWNPLMESTSKAPLLMLVDNGFTAAHDWRERMNLASARLEAAEREGRVVAVAATAAEPAEIALASPGNGLGAPALFCAAAASSRPAGPSGFVGVSFRRRRMRRSSGSVTGSLGRMVKLL